MMVTISDASASIKQSGQAAIEALVCLLALGVLWVGIAWLGRIQDLALHASHASRHAAFAATRQDRDVSVETVKTGAFHGHANQWLDRRGQMLQNSVYQDILVSYQRSNSSLPHAQDKTTDPRVVQLREDWLNADQRVLSAHVSLVPSVDLSRHAGGSLLKLHQFDASYPRIHRQTSILTGAGHASDDQAAADRIAKSDLAWSGQTNKSYRLGHKTASVGSRVDEAWNRPEPIFNWLQPWAELLPDHHLRPAR